MPRPTTTILYERFLGLNDQAPTEIGDFQASVLENLYIANEAQELTRRAGTDPITDVLATDSSFDGLHWVRIDGTNWLIGAHNGLILNLLGEPPYFVPNGLFRLTGGRDINPAFISNSLVIGDGLAQNVRFNGSNVAQMLPAQPASGATLASLGAGTLTGTYSYRFTFLSYDGNPSQPSVATSGITLASASGVTLSNIPQPTDGDDCSGIEVYRTTNGGTEYYRVASLAVGTTSYTDTTLDVDINLEAPLDETVVRFPPCQILANFGERLAGILSSTDGDNMTLYVSDYQEPWACPLIAPLDEVDNPAYGARIPLPDVPTGLGLLGNVLIVFFRGYSYRLIGDNPKNWDFHKWNDHGCVAHRTIQTYKNLMLWLGPDGIYAIEGSNAGVSTRRISDDIAEGLADISASDMALAHAFVWDDKYFICFPTTAFYFDLKYRVWGKHTSWTWRDASVTYNTGSTKEIIYAALYGDAQLWQLETGSDDDGEPIPVAWASKDRNMGAFGRQKRIHRVQIVFKAGTGTATVKLYRGGGELIQTFSHDLSSTQRTGVNISILDKRAVSAARDEYFRIRIETETEASEFRILAVGMHYTLAT